MTNPPPALDTERLAAAARRALEALVDLICNTRDPGVEALGAQFELRQALIGHAPVKPDQREWTIEVQWRDGTWRRSGIAYDDHAEAQEEFDEAAAGRAGRRPLRLVWATTTWGIEATHTPDD